MPSTKTIEKYAKMNEALELFKETNKDVFLLAADMEKAIKEVEDEIKADARESKEDIEHAGVKVNVIRKFRKWYEWTKLSTKTQNLLEVQGAVKYEVNKEAFEELVHNGKITQEQRAEAFQEEELSTSVTVKIVKK